MNKWWWVKRAVRWLFFAFRSRKIVVSCHWVKNRNFLWYNSVDAYALVRTVFCRSNRKKKTQNRMMWKCKPLIWYKGHEQNIGKTAENKGLRHIGCCRNPLFVFGAVPRQYGSGGYGQPQWSQVWPLCGCFDPCGKRSDPYGCECDPCGHGFDPSPCISVTSLCLREFMWMKNVQYPWTIFNSRPGGYSKIMP